MKTLTYNKNTFTSSVDQRLDNETGLDGLTYTEIAAGLFTSTVEGSFFAPKYNKTVMYREVTLNGALYGVGYYLNNSGDAVALNVLTEGMVKYNRRAKHVTVKTVSAFN